jgi:hypothetical protein
MMEDSGSTTIVSIAKAHLEIGWFVFSGTGSIRLHSESVDMLLGSHSIEKYF